MAKKLTALGVERLSVKSKLYARRVAENLYIKVMPTGRKFWLFRYVMPGEKKGRNLSLGELTEANNFKTATSKAEEYRLKVKDGIDPAIPEKNDDCHTLQDVYDLFMKKGVDRAGKPLRESTLKGYYWAFKNDILPALGDMEIIDIRKKHILPMLEAIEERGAPNQANQVYRRLQRVLSFAAARDLIEFNPMQTMEPAGKTQSRDRVLTADEIKTFMAWTSRSEEAHRILKLILLTGARPGEVAGITSKEISGSWWKIPASRTKTGNEHLVYLTSEAKALLKEDSFTISRHVVDRCLARALKSAVDFPEGSPRRKGGQHYPLYIDKFVPHDLRRTMATGLAALSFSDEIIDAVQGRQKRGVIATYNRHDYMAERKRAALAWTRRVQQIISGEIAGKVVNIKRSRA
jgi:integrase